MELPPDITPKEAEKRRKLSEARKEYIRKKREEGLKRYHARRKKEKLARERKEKKEKEKKKKLAEKERNKKKPGRKKKTGPKINWYKRRKKAAEKAKKKQQVRTKPPITYQVMLCRNGKRYFTIGKYRSSEDAYVAFNKQKEISDQVVFPRAIKLYENLENSIDECIIIKKTDEGPSMIRNEYGKLVEHKTDLEGWEIIDKFRNNVEETFWVWGYDNRKERKTFTWIYEEMIIGDGFDAYEFRRVFTYKNKLLVRYDDGSLGMVICKSDSDSVRMYNELQNFTKRDKVKQVIFIGDRSVKCPETEKLEKEIMDITGWNIKKVRMTSTTYCLKN